MWPWGSAAETPPPYVELARSGEVERRAAEAHELLGERCGGGILGWASVRE